MRRPLIPALLLCAVSAVAPALADGKHHHGRGHGHHHRAYERVVRVEPYVVVRPAPVVYRPAPLIYAPAPVRYHYRDVHYGGHHGHDDAYKWLAAAVVLGEIIHHTQGAHR